MMRPKPPANKQVKLVCKEGEAKCSSGVASCSDGSTDKQFQCNAPWLCSDGERELCSDGSFPKMVAKKDPKKQGWNKPVRRPKFDRNSFVNEDLDEDLIKETLEKADRIMDGLEINTKERNKHRDNIKKQTL